VFDQRGRHPPGARPLGHAGRVPFAYWRAVLCCRASTYQRPNFGWRMLDEGKRGGPFRGRIIEGAVVVTHRQVEHRLRGAIAKSMVRAEAFEPGRARASPGGDLLPSG